MLELTLEQVEALESVNPDYKGYGAVGSITQSLVNDGLIEINLLEENDVALWFAVLTPLGKETLEQVES